MKPVRIILMLSSLLLLGCGGEGGGTSETTETVTVSPTSISVTAEGGSVSVSISASSAWTAYAADSDADWISVDPAYSSSPKGTLTVKVDANDTYAAKTGSITVKCGTTRVSVPVYQSAQTVDTSIECPLSGYSLVWNDEFDYEGVPSTKKWKYQTGGSGWGNNELQTYVAQSTSEGTDVAYVSDGVLTIKLLKENGTVYSCRMNSKDAWTYGYMEASIKLPSGKGTWPAFWMMPYNYTTWPGDGEIDIMEEVGYNPNVVHNTIHCNKYNNGGTSVETATRTVSTSQTAFHTYGMEWTSDYITFYVDRKATLTYKNDGSGYNAWPFYNPFYFILNIAWGGNWGGLQGVDESCLPTEMQVDYVRVFQK